MELSFPSFSEEEISFLATDDATPAASRTLVCLDQSHVAGVACRCTPPPEVGSEALYALRGTPGGATGESKLRSQLSGTRQWNSTGERLHLSKALEGQEGRQVLARALRDRKLALLHKIDLIYMARVWGFRSDIWARKGAGAPSGPPPAASAAGGGALALRRPSAASEAPLPLWQLGLRLQPDLDELSALCAGCFAGHRSFAAFRHAFGDSFASSDFGPLVSAAAAAERRAVNDLCAHVRSRVMSASVAARRTNAQLLMRGDPELASTSAVRVLSHEPNMQGDQTALQLIAQLNTAVIMFTGRWETVWRRENESGELTRVQSETVAELRDGAERTLEWLARAGAFASRIRLGTWAEYCAAQVPLLASAEAFVEACERGNRERRLWSLELLSRGRLTGMPQPAAAAPSANSAGGSMRPATDTFLKLAETDHPFLLGE